MYESPIKLYTDSIQTKIVNKLEEQILLACQNVAVGVSHEELFRALKYDRNQYEKGYADGKADALAEVLRCKDCKHYMTIHCTCDGCCISDDWYCADGERRTDERKADGID